MGSVTKKQSETMNGIESWMAVTGRAPTIPELAGQLGIEHSVLLSRLDGLERGGYLKQRSRSAGEKRGLPLDLTLVGLRSVGAVIPILGQIRGGALTEALSEPEGVLRLPHAFKDARTQFALRVVGDSMSEVICDSDVVILELPTRDPRAGEITAVQLGFETTLKYFYSDHKQVTLKSHHPDFKPIQAPLEEVEVLGFYVGKMSARVAEMLLQ